MRLLFLNDIQNLASTKISCQNLYSARLFDRNFGEPQKHSTSRKGERMLAPALLTRCPKHQRMRIWMPRNGKELKFRPSLMKSSCETKSSGS